MTFKVNDFVYYCDPDDSVSSGVYQVFDISGEIYSLTNKTVELEAYVTELQSAFTRYNANEYAVCPLCQSPDIEAKSLISCNGGESIIRPISCLECGAEWDDAYTLTSIDIQGPGDLFRDDAGLEDAA